MMSATSAETLSSFLILKISNIFFISFFYRVLGIPLFLQEEPYQEEVYRDADAEGGYHSQLFGKAQANEEVEAEGLHRVVDDVGEGESCSALGIRLYLEGIAGAGDEIEDETYDVGDGVGGGSQTVVAYVGDEMGQCRHHSQVDDILQHRSQSAYDSESDDFAQLLPSGIIHIIYLVPDIHVAKVLQNLQITK